MAMAPVSMRVIADIVGAFMGSMLPVNWSHVIRFVAGNSPHFLGHMVLAIMALFSLGVEHCRRILLFNVGLAVSIESWQSHSFFRSAEFMDILFGVFGAVGGVAVGLLASRILFKRSW